MPPNFLDRPRYNGTNLPLATEVAPIGHVGAGGTSEHPAATTSTAGFMSAADKSKSDAFNSNSYYWYAYQNTQQLNIPSATVTRLNMDTILGTRNGGGNFNTTTGRMVAPVSGIYKLGGGYMITPAVTAKEVRLYFTHNASANYIIQQGHTNGTGSVGAYGGIEFYCDATDTMELAVYHTFAVNTSDIIQGQVSTYFWGSFSRSI